MSTIESIFSAWSIMVVSMVTGFICLVLLLVGVGIKVRRLWRGALFGIIVSVVAFLGCGAYAAHTIASKVSQKVKESKQQRLKPQPVNPDVRDYVLNDSTRTAAMDSLMAWEPSRYAAIIPAGFYTYFGHDNWYRLPLVYPYSLGCKFDLNEAQLYNEMGVTDFAESSRGNTRKPYAGFIERICFDQNYLLMEGRLWVGSDRIDYHLLDFRTGDISEFETEGRLRQAAKKDGFVPLRGEQLVEIPWMTIREYSDAL